MTSGGGHAMLCLAWQAARERDVKVALLVLAPSALGNISPCAFRERDVKVALLVLAPLALGNISPCAFEEMLARMNLVD